MTKKITLSIFIIVWSNTLTAQHNLPSFSDIVESFFLNYDLKPEQRFDDIRFVKQKEGYFVESYNYKTEDYDNKVLFWSANKKYYEKLDFPKNSKQHKAYIKHHLSNSLDKELFNSLPYYGYTNWTQDVITLLENKPKLKDVELYALGRAYSASASDLLNSNSQFANPKVRFKLEESGKNLLAKQQLKSYKTLVNKAIENYSNLCNKNPEFPTIVGSICNKLHNEYMSSYLSLIIHQNEFEASEYLPNDLYSDLYINDAKNYLKSLEPNAILFTTGDNDTYPYLYAQAKLKYRRDVRIINTSLLNYNNYVNHLRNDSLFESDPIKMNLLPDTYSKEKLDLIFLENNKDSIEYIGLKQLIKQLNTQNPSTVYQLDKRYSQFSSNKISIDISAEEKLKLRYQKSYLYQGELLTLDIIQANMNIRPIYCASIEIPEFANYLELNGFASKITLNPKNPLEDDYIAGINAEKTYQVLVKDFEFNKKTEKHLDTKLSVLINYNNSFNILSKHYMSVGNQKKCKDVLSKFIDFYPKNIYSFSKFMILDMIETAYSINLDSEGDKMVSNILQNLENNRNKNNSTFSKFLKQKQFKSQNSYQRKEQLETNLYFINELKDLKLKNRLLLSRIKDLEYYYISELKI